MKIQKILKFPVPRFAINAFAISLKEKSKGIKGYVQGAIANAIARDVLINELRRRGWDLNTRDINAPSVEAARA